MNEPVSDGRPVQPGADVRWITAFIDLPARGFDGGSYFWAAATGALLSPRRGPHGELATLVPPDGDPYLRVRRIDSGPVGIHLDLHVADEHWARVVQHAHVLGATKQHEAGYVTMSSPGGMAFCIVGYHGEAVRPSAVTEPDGSRSLVDQVCIDVPATAYEAETAFWAALTGWEPRTGVFEEFTYLVRPPGMPLRLLLQRLGEDDPGLTVRAHLDVACGPHVDEIATRDERRGATVQRRERFWTTMSDPVGLAYCLTSRDPVTGSLPA